jgi:hypothetical protein
VTRSQLSLTKLALLLLFAVIAPAQAQGSLDDKLKDMWKKATHPTVQRTQGGITVHTDAPANDNFAGRATLTGSEASARADIRYATTESGEPMHMPHEPSHGTLWWTWTAPATGQVTLDTLNIGCDANQIDIAFYTGDTLATLLPVARHWGSKSGGNTQTTALAVYTGEALDGLTSVAQNTASTDGYTLGFSVRAGTAYQIAANGYDESCTGQVAFNLYFHAASQSDAPHILHQTPQKGTPMPAKQKKSM